jgi:hypothetical protein
MLFGNTSIHDDVVLHDVAAGRAREGVRRSAPWTGGNTPARRCGRCDTDPCKRRRGPRLRGDNSPHITASNSHP